MPKLAQSHLISMIGMLLKLKLMACLWVTLSRGEAAKLAGKVVNKTVPAVIDGGWKDEESTGSYGVKLAINNVNDLL